MASVLAPSTTCRFTAQQQSGNRGRSCFLRPSVLWAAVPARRRCNLQQRLSVAASAPAGSVAPPVMGSQLKLETDSRGVQRLALQPEGWNTWKWRGHNINWLGAGTEGPPVVLIHGFGASAYHWRYNVPELAKHCRVYALDCLGFGWSSKPLVDYKGYNLWEDQIADFIREVVGGDKAIVVGNSLGGYNATAVAADYPELVRGVVLLNAAGRFDDPNAPTKVPEGAAAAAADVDPGMWNRMMDQVSSFTKRSMVMASFYYAKSPMRIRQVLRQVYHNPASLDEDLVQSIAIPAQDPNAAEVFYRIITGSGKPMNRLLDKLDAMPLLLLWGSKDPWCVPARATQIQQHYPTAERVDIESGHCPHDDTPSLVNSELLRWIMRLEEKSLPASALGKFP